MKKQQSCFYHEKSQSLCDEKQERLSVPLTPTARKKGVALLAGGGGRGRKSSGEAVAAVDSYNNSCDSGRPRSDDWGRKFVKFRREKNPTFFAFFHIFRILSWVIIVLFFVPGIKVQRSLSNFSFHRAFLFAKLSEACNYLMSWVEILKKIFFFRVYYIPKKWGFFPFFALMQFIST